MRVWAEVILTHLLAASGWSISLAALFELASGRLSVDHVASARIAMGPLLPLVLPEMPPAHGFKNIK